MPQQCEAGRAQRRVGRADAGRGRMAQPHCLAAGALRALGLAALLILVSGHARAQFLDRVISPDVTGVADEQGVTVATRQRPDYEPPEVRLGQIIVQATETESLGYDNNVTGYQPYRGSPVLETAATVNARTDWASSAIFGGATVENAQYWQTPNQSGTNWSADVGATYQLDRDLISATYQHTTELLRSRDIDVPDLAAPVETSSDDAQLLYRAVWDRLTLQPGLEYVLYRYSNGIADGQPYIGSLRDRDVFAPNVTAQYEVAPLSNLVAVLQTSFAHYVSDQIGVLPGYTDVTALAGYDTTLGDVWRLVLLGGYEERSFKTTYHAISAPLARVRVVWTPTGLTSLTGTVTRQITDNAYDFVALTTVTLVSLRVDHELRRNVLLHAQAGVQLYDGTQGNPSGRLYTIGAGADWLLNEYASLGAEYQFRQREEQAGTVATETIGPSYTEHEFLLQVKLKL